MFSFDCKITQWFCNACIVYNVSIKSWYQLKSLCYSYNTLQQCTIFFVNLFTKIVYSVRPSPQSICSFPVLETSTPHKSFSHRCSVFFLSLYLSTKDCKFVQMLFVVVEMCVCVCFFGLCPSFGQFPCGHINNNSQNIRD